MKTAFKAFDKDLKCRDYQFEVGKTYKHDGEVEICHSGFHSCENPLDVLSYYDLTDSRFCVVEANGDIKPHNEDSKIASSEITIKKELTLSEYILACTTYIVSNTASGYSSKLATSGDDSQLATSGDYSQLATSGDYSQLATSGYSSKLAASGDDSKLAASGKYSQLAASGKYSQLAASGNYSQLATSGYSSQLAASGKYSQLATSGNYSQLAASGDDSQLATSGDSSIACISGINGRTKGGKDCAMSLAYFDSDYNKYRIVVAYVGENGIKQDTWYQLNDKHEFTECEE